MSEPLEFYPLAYIEPLSSGMYDYALGGSGLLVKQLQIVVDCSLVDVVAWRSGGDRKNWSPWWTRRGVVTFLGQHELDSAVFEQRPARMVATPQAYLNVSGDAFCVLDWTAPIGVVIEGCGEIVCDSLGLAARLKRVLITQSSKLTITVGGISNGECGSAVQCGDVLS